MKRLIPLLLLLSPMAWAGQIVPTTTLVPVLKDAVQKGEFITADNIMQKEVSASDVFVSTITDAEQLQGQQASRALVAGQPVNRLHVRVAPAVARNAAVTLHFVRGGVELSGKGQALDDGQIGQTVRVLNPSTRVTVVGVVQPGGVVEIN